MRARAAFGRASDVPRNSEEWRSFLQRRVKVFGRTLALFVLGFYVFANGVGMLHPKAHWSDWVSPLNLLVLAAGLVCFVVWLASRGGARSTGELETIDAVATVATGACIGLTAIHAPPVQRPEVQAMLGVIIFVILRAIVIPATGARTFVLSAITSVPAIYAAWRCHVLEPDAPYKLPVAQYPGQTAVFAGLGVMAATLASRTIFGLRKRASEAQKLGQYTLGEKVGEGGMGAVYRASHAMMKREVAIKLLATRDGDGSGKDALARFEREVQLTSRLESPNTIAIYDYGRTPEGVFYYVMEYIDGYSLEDLVEQFGPVPAERAVHLVRQICSALAEAHAIGLIHRDIKPANVALCERAGVHDFVKVLDFGLVKELGTDSGATRDAALTGTPLYLSPEGITTPQSVDGRSDLYAVGGVLYWLLTGTHVFAGSTIVEVCSHHLHSKPEPPSKRLGAPVPADVEAVVLACLAKDPKDRLATAEALAAALDACDCAESWSDALAAAWWRDHGKDAVRPRAKSISPSQRLAAVDVDLEGRAS
jgi:serine/threonine-protein kinase